MSKREDAIGALIFDELLKHAKVLSMNEMFLLRGAITGRTPYTQLPVNLRIRFSNVGIEFLKKLPTLG